MISVAIQGGAGIVGGELIRLLQFHPDVKLGQIQSNSFANQPVVNAHPDLLSLSSKKFSENIDVQHDVVFLCGGHGNSKQILDQHLFSQQTKLIDLSNDFRIDNEYVGRNFAYGLVERNSAQIQSAQNIANPGCFATAIQLALLPIVDQISSTIHVSGITGSTGAGIQLQDSVHFTKRSNNISAYKSLEHQHIPEVVHQLGISQEVLFVPYKGDFTRGIYCTTYVETDLLEEGLVQLYQNFYQSSEMVIVINQIPQLKQVVNTNYAILGIQKIGKHAVIYSAIDNLLKGAAGQAVQNMNLMYGFELSAGLQLKSTAY